MTIGMTCEVDPYIRTTESVEHLADEKIVVETIQLENKTRHDVDSEVVQSPVAYHTVLKIYVNFGQSMKNNI